MAALEARGLTEPIQVGQHTFSLVGDVQTFVQRYVGDRANFGVLCDVVILLHKTKSPTAAVGQAAINDEIAATKIRLDTMESNILASFAVVLPRPFDSAGGGVTTSATNPLPSIKTAQDWSMPLTGRKALISQELTNETKVIGDRIRAAKMAPEASAVFELLRIESGNHWHRLAGFIDTYYQTQTSCYKMDPTEAWLLTGKCVRETFVALRERRIHGQDLISDCESKQEQFVRAMWAVLLCHQTMQSIMNADFTGHIALAHVVHEHLLANKVTSSEITKLRTTAAANQTGLCNLSSEVDRLLAHSNLSRQAPAVGDGEDDSSTPRNRGGRRRN